MYCYSPLPKPSQSCCRSSADLPRKSMQIPRAELPLCILARWTSTSSASFVHWKFKLPCCVLLMPIYIYVSDVWQRSHKPGTCIAKVCSSIQFQVLVLLFCLGLLLKRDDFFMLQSYNRYSSKELQQGDVPCLMFQVQFSGNSITLNFAYHWLLVHVQNMLFRDNNHPIE